MENRDLILFILGRLGLCAISFAAMAFALRYAVATRGTGDFESIAEPVSWSWVLIAAFMYGFWGYASILLSILTERPLGRVIFAVLGVLYLLAIGFMGFEAFGKSPDGSQIFSVVLVPIMSTIIMIPLFLLCGLLAKIADQ